MTLKNTENDVIIKIKNIQTAEDMNEQTELITEGRFYESNGKLYIFYSEDEIAETSACTVMIVVNGKNVTISRKGDFSSKMNYTEGECEQILYHTPYGDIPLVLRTIKIKNMLTESGGELNLQYKLSVNGENINNNLTITVNTGKGERG